MARGFKTENAVNVPKILWQFASPMAMGDKLQGQGIQRIPPFSSLDFCCSGSKDVELPVLEVQDFVV